MIHVETKYLNSPIFNTHTHKQGEENKNESKKKEPKKKVKQVTKIKITHQNHKQLLS
jgi:hypothetical protein